MAKAIETGLPKMRIEEAAARKQARIDSGKDVIVGVNAYQLRAEETAGFRCSTWTIRRCASRRSQRLEELRRERDTAAVAECARSARPTARETGDGNLLELAVDAARKRATLGEISTALEKVWGRYQAVDAHHFRRVLGGEQAWTRTFRRRRQMADEFAASRRPPPAHPGGQDGTGRPRSRLQGDRHRIRRPGLRRGYRSAVPDSARSGAPRRRERRARGGRLLAGRRATRRWCRS